MAVDVSAPVETDVVRTDEQDHLPQLDSWIEPEEGDVETTSALSPVLAWPPRWAKAMGPRASRVVALVPLGVILSVQAWNSVQLIRSNTAFLDEATYLGAGHRLFQTWLHGGANLHYPNYFSGAPAVYSPVAAIADSIGGLTAARLLSLVFMLLTTVFVYACARRLYGTAAAWLAAAVFTSVEGTQFLGALATFDAMALVLLALATWIVIATTSSTRSEPHGGIYLAAPVMALADATKYASTLYDLVIVAIAFVLVASHHGWRQALKVAVVLLGITVAICAALLALGGPSYAAGISSTTLLRPAGTTSVSHVLHDALSWVGILSLLAVVAALSLGLDALWSRRGKAAAVLGMVLALAVLLAPANEARIHTTTSLNKHVVFGAFFGAVVVGSLVTLPGRIRARRSGRTGPEPAPRTWRAVRVVLAGAAAAAVVVPMYILGTNQARYQFQTWIDSGPFVATLRPLVAHTKGPILVDDAQVPDYYLGNSVPATRWYDTFYLSYTPPGSHTTLVGIPAYTAAVRHHYFDLIALDFGAQHRIDAAVVRGISSSHLYRFVTKVEVSDVFGHSAYVIWRYKGA
jgi:4-amino-4-deoxy-L-arabinose transferase-like glycosyltransferase